MEDNRQREERIKDMQKQIEMMHKQQAARFNPDDETSITSPTRVKKSSLKSPNVSKFTSNSKLGNKKSVRRTNRFI